MVEKDEVNGECIKCRWVYSVEHVNDKKVYKARLVARGDMLEKSDESYSPVVKATTIRVLPISDCVFMRFKGIVFRREYSFFKCTV